MFEVLVAEGELVGRRVVEIGCGTGHLAAALADRGARVWGVDPSEEMLRQAHEKAAGAAGFKRAQAEALPFRNGWFERAVFRLVVHLVDRPAAFGEARRILAPGGRVVIATFDPDSFDSFWLARVFPNVIEIDRGRFPPESALVRDLDETGFANVRTRKVDQSSRLSRAEALERIRGRFISTLRLLDDEAYAEGVARAERELPEIVDDRRAWLVVVAERL